MPSAGATGPHNVLSNGLSWDEQNIALHDFEKENTQRMKIDEPKTPFVRGAGMDEEGFDGESGVCYTSRSASQLTDFAPICSF